MDEAVLLGPFWAALACNAPPATQLALAGTSRLGRDAAVQHVPKATLTLQLSPPPTPDTLAVLRNSGRTLPAGIIINNNNAHLTPIIANHIARLMLPQLSSPVVASLQLGGDGPFLVDTALLIAISAALPALSKLMLSNISLADRPDPTPANPGPAFPALHTVSIDADIAFQPTKIHRLLAVLGVRAGGGVINLELSLGTVELEPVLGPMLLGNQLHALRKLSLPDAELRRWGAEEVGGALIRNAPALEHLMMEQVDWYNDEHGTSAMCVPWRIVEVKRLHVTDCSGLPLGSQPGQPPLILRVMHGLTAGYQDASPGTKHLVSTAPGKRQVQLECTHEAYHSINTYTNVEPILRALTLTTTGLSNLILDGIDSADDIKDLIDLSTTGLDIEMVNSMGVQELRDLPHVTKLRIRSDDHGCWDRLDVHMLASLPAHITDVHLSAGPSLKLVSRMCVEVSRLPHRQARPLRLCVPGVVGWFAAAVRAIEAAGMNTPGVTAAQ